MKSHVWHCRSHAFPVRSRQRLSRYRKSLAFLSQRTASGSRYRLLFRHALGLLGVRHGGGKIYDRAVNIGYIHPVDFKTGQGTPSRCLWGNWPERTGANESPNPRDTVATPPTRNHEESYAPTSFGSTVRVTLTQSATAAVDVTPL